MSIECDILRCIVIEKLTVLEDFTTAKSRQVSYLQVRV